MAFTPAFTVGNTQTGDTISPAQIILTDVSVGSDVLITDRVILLYQADGTLLTPAINWPIGTNPITISPLTIDVSLNLVINWNNAGGTILYTASQLCAFTGFDELFCYRLIESQSSKPNIINDTNFYDNFSKLRVEIDSAQQAITVGQDLAGSQYCIERAYNFVTNSSLYFGN